ncbi:MAG: hypothetical protein HFH08_05600 [Bacilli bacterium]|nr:hypothetical protein [Bacilli bacterium]
MEMQKLRTLYTEYGKIQLGNIEALYGNVDNSVKLKIKHGISMSKSVPRITAMSGLFHESFEESAAIDGLFHDIGRFFQYLLIGNLKDAELEEKYGIKDHGRLGELLLNDEFITKFGLNEYASILKPVVGNHTEIYDSKYALDLSKLPPIFKEYSMEEILKRAQLRNYLIAAKIKLVVEADNFELLQNIVNRDWVPEISEKEEGFVTKEAWEQFTNNLPIMIAEFKKRKVWSVNSGAILRYGLLPQKAQLRSTLELLLEQDYLRLLYERAVEGIQKPDPLIYDGYLYATLLVKNIIELSDPIITEEQRREAVEKTKKMWK